MDSVTCWPELPSANLLTEQVACRHWAHASWRPGSGGPALTWRNCVWGWRNLVPLLVTERTYKQVSVSHQEKEIEHWREQRVSKVLQTSGFSFTGLLGEFYKQVNSEMEIIIFLRSQKKSMSKAKLQLRNCLCIFLRVYSRVIYLWKSLNF